MRTFRQVDGEQVPGRSRYVFVHDGGTYFLTALTVYADGLVDCWGLMDFDELRTKLESGWITTEPRDGAEASIHDLAGWQFSRSRCYVNARMLMAELLDTVEQLNGRPTAAKRCMELIDRYLAEPTEANRLAVRAAYLAVPEHRRRRMLGDMDRKDAPVRWLISDVGQPPIGGRPHGRVVTPDDRQEAVAYLTDHAQRRARAGQERPAYLDDPRRAPTFVLREVPYAQRWPAPPGPAVLTWDYPAPVSASGRTYATLTHAVLALSAARGADHDRVAVAAGPEDARTVAADLVRRADWAERRLAVMAALLRTRLAEYPMAVRTLLDTGDGRVVYHPSYLSAEDGFWTATGANWYGRLLEILRSEHAMSGSTMGPAGMSDAH